MSTIEAIAWRRVWTVLALIAVVSVVGFRPAVGLGGELPSVEVVPGKYSLTLGEYDMSLLGYVSSEVFVKGTAHSYKFAEPPMLDGKWHATALKTEPYLTRLVIARPQDNRKFNGTVVVEWLNVGGGRDVPSHWLAAHRELTRQGYGYVAVSAQRGGIDGGNAVQGTHIAPLKVLDPQRYARLTHPGDAYSFDIFTQVGKLLKTPDAGGFFPGLQVQHVLAVGESQSALYLVTYVNAIDPIAAVYDGFLIHSRFARPAPLDGGSVFAPPHAEGPAETRLRPDNRVPVLNIVTENDVIGATAQRVKVAGYAAVRQADGKLARNWEIAGTAHADNYNFIIAFIDSGKLPSEELAELWRPTHDVLSTHFDNPMNGNPAHHYVAMAALRALNRWVSHGIAPTASPPIALEPGSDDKARRDEHGNAVGGLRTPWVDVPVAAYSGVGNSGNPQSWLAGSTVPFDSATLARLYPHGRSDYLSRFGVALDAAIKHGFVLFEDREEILKLAALGFSGVNQ